MTEYICKKEIRTEEVMGKLVVKVESYDSLITRSRFDDRLKLDETFGDYLIENLPRYCSIKDYSLRVMLAGKNMNKTMEEEVKRAIDCLIEGELDTMRKDISKIIKKIVYSFILGLLMMILTYTMSGITGQELSQQIVIEIMKVSAWMFIWHGFQFLFFDVVDKLKKNNVLKSFKDISEKTVFFYSEAA